MPSVLGVVGRAVHLAWENFFFFNLKIIANNKEKNTSYGDFCKVCEMTKKEKTTKLVALVYLDLLAVFPEALYYVDVHVILFVTFLVEYLHLAMQNRLRYSSQTPNFSPFFPRILLFAF